MATAQPYLLGVAVKRRLRVDDSEIVASRYDEDLMITVVNIDGQEVPAVTQPNFAGARTKKNDIEKGDDMKDTTPPPQPRPRPSPRPER